MREMKPGTNRSVGRDNHRKRYAEYMSSREWFERRRVWFEEEQRRSGSPILCVGQCGSEWSLNNDLHHCTYDRLGNEKHEDLWAMCRSCHNELHKIIEQKSWRWLPYFKANVDGLALLRVRRKPAKSAGAVAAATFAHYFSSTHKK